MFTFIRNAVTRVALPFFWRRSPAHAASTLKQFGETEFDSGWQYLNAMAYTDNVRLRQMLFENVLEEFRHSDYFLGAAHTLATSRLQGVAQARLPLVQASDDLPLFLAYAHQSEKSIHDQFDVFAKSCHLPAVTDVFNRICGDEAEHEVEARTLLEEIIGSAKSAGKLIRKAKLKRAYEAWMRGSQHIGDFMFSIVLTTTFLIYGPLVGRTPRPARPSATVAPQLTPKSAG